MQNKAINNNILIGDSHSQKTQGLGSNSSRTNKDDEDDFDFSFDEDFLLELQKGGLELDD